MDKLKRKLAALDKLSVIKNAELSTCLVQHKEANSKLSKIEKTINELDRDIENLERNLHSIANTDKALSLDDYAMVASFLKQKTDIQHNNHRQFEFAKTKCDKIKDNIAIQNLTLRGINNLRERQKLLFSSELVNKEQKQHDDDWLHRDEDIV